MTTIRQVVGARSRPELGMIRDLIKQCSKHGPGGDGLLPTTREHIHQGIADSGIPGHWQPKGLYRALGNLIMAETHMSTLMGMLNSVQRPPSGGGRSPKRMAQIEEQMGIIYGLVSEAASDTKNYSDPKQEFVPPPESFFGFKVSRPTETKGEYIRRMMSVPPLTERLAREIKALFEEISAVLDVIARGSENL